MMIKEGMFLSKYLKNKDLLDFGCGWGGFLNFAKNAKFKAGIELRKECIKFINKNLKKLNYSILLRKQIKNLISLLCSMF